MPTKTEVYDSDSILVSKVTYVYDQGNFNDTSLEQNPTGLIRRDATNYGTTYITGRGNLTSMTRWDVSNGASVTSSVKYNVAGAPVAQTDPMGRTVKISYADAFNDGLNSRKTFAYPTKVTETANTDMMNNYSLVKYRFDIGANVWAKSPKPYGSATGKETGRKFDVKGRLERQSVLINGAEYAYSRYFYSDNGVHAQTYTTLVEGAGEAMTESWTDGAGRVRQSRTEHPGSAGGYSAQITEYDSLGRVKRQSVPTEVNVNWSPTGDDAAGYLWNEFAYDWKGRTTREINTDGTDKVISYEGCGCAGGEITTVKGEEIVESDWQGYSPTPLGRRTQKIYSDILGRNYKTEILNWDGSVYSTAQNVFNGRDQVISSTQTEASTGVTQTAAMTYDGHGRLKTQKRPEQDNPTTYNYNADDSISSVVDARGATANYIYNGRGLLQEISYAVPSGSNIPTSPTVSFEYDALGNRKKMTDGLGYIDYAYNHLSQLVSETRYFSDSLPNKPASGNFKLTYTYTLSGQLKSLKDPYEYQFNYEYDGTGRLSSVQGATPFAGIAHYAGNAHYNARGALTSLDYGNGVEMNITSFNNKLQATGMEIKKGATSIIKKEYQFYGDGSLKFTKDVNNGMFDRFYKYDAVGRTVEAKSGANARGQSAQAELIPYRQNFAYNAFGNITETTMEHYASGQTVTPYTFTNNRNAASTYDAEGNAVADENAVYQYDAAGRLIESKPRDPNNAGQFTAPTLKFLDGTGQETKRIENYVAGGNNSFGTSYFIRSSVTGKIVSEVNSTGEKHKTFVSANGVTVAEQLWGWNGSNREEFVNFYHQDASGSSVRMTDKNGNLNAANEAEHDASGANVGTTNPYIQLFEPPPSDGTNTDLGNLSYPGMAGPMGRTYMVDGIPVSAEYFMMWMDTVSFGGAFGLLERAARMSVRDYSVRFNDGNRQYERFFGNEEAARDFAVRMNQNTVYRNILVNDSWSILALISTQTQRQPQQQQETPKTPQGANYSRPEMNALTNAYNEVLRRLENPDCAALFTDFYDNFLQSLSDSEDFDPTGRISSLKAKFKSVADRNPSTVFKNILFRFLAFPRQPGQGLAGASTPTRTDVHINSNGPFVSRNILVDGQRRNFDFGGRTTNLSQTEYGALLLLHELGHAYGAVDGLYLFFGPDAGNPALNRQYTESVINACFPELGEDDEN